MNPESPGELGWPKPRDFSVDIGKIRQPVLFVLFIYSVLSVKTHFLVTSTKPAWMLLLCWFRIYIVHREDQVVWV